MIRLQLERAEAETLLRLLEYYHGELRMEIAGTEQTTFREQLKAEKRTLKKIREELSRLLEAEAEHPQEIAP